MIRLYVQTPPSEYELAMYGIPPGSAVIYEVELLDIKPTPPDVLEITLLPPAPIPPPDPPSGYSVQQIIETWGWNTTRRAALSKFGFGDDELTFLTTGLMAGVKGEPPPYDLDQIGPAVHQFVQEHVEKARRSLKRNKRPTRRRSSPN